MSVERIILVNILMFFIVFDICICENGKHTTSSQIFMKLKSNQASKCKFIDRDFHKLQGVWHYVLRTVTSRNTSKLCNGHLTVSEILANGFLSDIQYTIHGGAIVRTPMTALFINRTVAGIPELSNIIQDRCEFKHPFLVQMGICDNDTILVIEPIYYFGGAMIFTRHIPDSIIPLKLRFGTNDEQKGKEYMVKVAVDCAL